MPSTSRPRSFSGASTGSTRSSQNTPMSERQQMALLMQMTSSTNQAELSPGGHNTPARSRDRNERGETALHVAAIKGDHDGVKKLLEQGMSPNVADFAGWTPLHEACNHGHHNVAHILVKAGANVNARGLDDDTPLHDAAIVGQLKLVKMLVERGADPCFKNRKGKTPCDVAAPAVYNFLITARDAAGGRSTQQMKKTSLDSKKLLDDTDTESTVGSTLSGSTGANANTNSNASNSNKDEDDDIYEFKSTPKDSSSSSGDDKSDGGKGSDKSSDEKSDDQGIGNSTTTGSSSGGGGGTSGSSSSGGIIGNQSKRLYADMETNNDDCTTTGGDDESKRKKRKDSNEQNSKEATAKSAATSRGTPQRIEKNAKTAGPSKSICLSSKSAATLERKSPCPSPKLSGKSTDSDAEMDDNKSGDSFGGGGGPKVPPLKIVIPQQNIGGDPETGSRNGKNASTRNHAALPYVVASSSNSNDSADKESSSSRCTSPSDSAKSTDDKKPTFTDDQQRQQRVLRSSHRGGGTSVDRSSNNSSPQLQSTSPSPAPLISTTEANEANTTKPNASATSAATAAAGASSATAATATGPSITASTSSLSTTTLPNQSANQQESTAENPINAPSPSASSVKDTTASSTVDLHPRKRKIRASKEDSKQNNTTNPATTSNSENNDTTPSSEIHPHDQPITNCYQMYLNIRKQIERKQRSLFPVQPKPPQGFKGYLMNRCTYLLASKTPAEPVLNVPSSLATPMKDTFAAQEKERHKLKMQHVVEKEKLVLAVEQEILRVHGRAARALANQSLPFSACTILKDEEVYNMITPEQEEHFRTARSRYNGRLFISWLQDVDDKWEKIKEAMVLRHHNEAESLHAVQKMDWEWKMKELSLCEYNAQPDIDETHVPIVHVSDDFDLLPA